MARKKAERNTDMKDEISIDYDELMTELKKYERPEFTDIMLKALVEAREKYNVPYSRIAQMFTEKFGRKFTDSQLQYYYAKFAHSPGR